MAKLSELLEIHNELEEKFFEHQRRLLRFEFDKALSLLEEYESALSAHIEDENTHLLPIYAERGNIEKGGAVQMFLDEHEKLINHLALFKEEIRGLPFVDDQDRRLIWLLEREAFYKKLCDHHDIRETRILYPELDRITTDPEKEDLLAKVNRTFR